MVTDISTRFTVSCDFSVVPNQIFFRFPSAWQESSFKSNILKRAPAHASHSNTHYTPIGANPRCFTKAAHVMACEHAILSDKDGAPSTCSTANNIGVQSVADHGDPRWCDAAKVRFGKRINLFMSDVYFGRDKAILKQRERIKRKTLEARRLHHRQHAA